MDYWILMGDIVGSSESDSISLQKEFSKLIGKINLEYKDQLKSPLTITLGDEFQGIVEDLKKSIQIIVRIEEEKWKLEYPILIRYSLGFGEISTPINSEIAFGMLGQGLSEVRNSLTELKVKEERIVLTGDIHDKEKVSLSLGLLLEKQEDWKWKDHEVISGYFQGKDYKRVAEELDKDKSLIWRRFKSLGFVSYEKRKRLLEIIVKNES
ncbi:SatD family protein [Algoriphagus sp. PAP.12]|uniref:SatD family protein n=1 Tax=Algoriphagus sp. PAP.12 TaxID=2996678 RepID=UPI00227A75F1|nr:SatD family protein [Algoriphagus sp. PAP.12]